MTGEARIEAVLMALLALADLVIGGLLAACAVSDSTVLSCRQGDGIGATCTVVQSTWLGGDTSVYLHVTGAVVRVQDDGEGGEDYHVRLVGESGGIGPPGLTRQFWHRKDADSYAAHLGGLIAAVPDRSFSEQVRPRRPVWQMVILLPSFTLSVSLFLLLVLSPIWMRVHHLAWALMRAWRRLATWFHGVVAAVVILQLQGQLRRGEVDAVRLQRRLARTPQPVREKVGRWLMVDRRSTAVLLQVAYGCFWGSPPGRVPIVFHPNVTAELQDRVLSDAGAREAVAAHPDAPPELLADLALDPLCEVRRAAMANPNATAEVKALAWLAN